MAKYKIYDFLGGLSIPISQAYGNDVEYYRQISNGNLKNGHEGTDFPTLNGTKLFTPFEKGIIVRAGQNIAGWENYGKFIVIWDPVQCIALWFCHLQDYFGKVDDVLRLGDPFCLTNNTGNTRGEHVHVNLCETDKSGVRLNTNNGSLGFLDLMDTNLVEIVPLPGKEKPVQPPVQPTPVIANKTTTLTLTIPSTDTIDDYMGIKKSDFLNLRGKCDLYDPMADAGYRSLADIDTVRKELVQQKTDQQAEYEKVLKQKDETITGLLTDVKTAKDQTDSVLGEFQKSVQADSSTADTAIDAHAKATDLERDIRMIADNLKARPNSPSILDKLDALFTQYDYFRRQFEKAQQPSPVKEQVQKIAKLGESSVKALLTALGAK